MTTGERIKEKRKELGITAEELGEKAGVNRSTIYRYEKGDIEKLPISVIETVAKVLRTSVSYLMGTTESHKCEICGMTYMAGDPEDERLHNECHHNFLNAIKRFGFYYPYEKRESIKLNAYNIIDDPDVDMDTKIATATDCLKAYFSRSLETSNFNILHVTFPEYVSIMLNNKEISFLKEDAIYEWFRDKYGVSDIKVKGTCVPPGISQNKDLEKYGLRPIVKKRLPLLGNIACGEPKYADEDRESYIEAGADIGADFCLRANGDSMINARIHDGDIVFIRSMPQVENGQIAAVIIDDEATLKRVYYYPENNMMILKPENPKYKDLIYIGQQLEDIHILGLAVAFQSDVI